MIKTIKVKKQFRLDELIKYIFDNEIVDKKFSSDIKLEPYYDNKNSVYVHPNGTVSLGLGQTNEITPEDTFTVEVEEEITEDTRIPKTATLTKNEEVLRSWNNSINGLKKVYPDALQIHAIVNGKLQLIWEAE